ncbi:hypothetical protein pmac_cds_726 [Pandoravirus macleodensis]|uniref:Uncharacterized protein n=1 Tax=Pandoravirus macleodensis TaxID=2107707 RepID=A0A2U7UG19_9VIRU|nr:hypothetical protein pmac_cds_726 [Pandoravirus macleodensis]AVK77414.1 hypothetical protein pmac_cds_726 [Pandoravirus macleodensis]
MFMMTALMCIVLALCAVATPADAASGDAIHPGALVKIYAVGPSQWVRRSPTHSTSPVRAADNISKSQATSFLFEGGATGSPIPLPSGNLYLVDAFTTRPYCDPRPVVSGWFDSTLMCWETSDGPWLSLTATSTGPNTVLNDGDEVYLFNGRNHQWCRAPTWPTNNAAIYCDSGDVSGTDNSILRFRIYLA